MKNINDFLSVREYGKLQNIREKSGNFEANKKWQPCPFLPGALKYQGFFTAIDGDTKYHRFFIASDDSYVLMVMLQKLYAHYMRICCSELCEVCSH